MLYIYIFPFASRSVYIVIFHPLLVKRTVCLDYATALAKEINSIKDKKIKTIFIGGGTPTYLSLEGWEIIKKSIDKLDNM